MSCGSKGKETVASVKYPGRKVNLAVEVDDVFTLKFLWSKDGRTWNELGGCDAASVSGKAQYRPGVIALDGGVQLAEFAMEPIEK